MITDLDSWFPASTAVPTGRFVCVCVLVSAAVLCAQSSLAGAPPANSKSYTMEKTYTYTFPRTAPPQNANIETFGHVWANDLTCCSKVFKMPFLS